jgi:hypothetical protein
MYLRNSLEHVFLFFMQSLLKLLVLDHFFWVPFYWYEYAYESDLFE